ncbi:MAG TPA: hypothetical protein VJ859_09770 [Allosphingosinicella sp.]|nr:hypothetical protein [Allosphingosinicella sp.]
MTRTTFALTLLALAGGAVAAGPSVARSSVAVGHPVGHGAVGRGSFFPGPAFPAYIPMTGHRRFPVSGRFGSDHHIGSGHGGHDHRGLHRRTWGSDDGYWIGSWGYDADGDGYVNTIPMLDQNGYFATGGEVIRHGNAAPTYDYDRGYPYDWYNSATTVRIHSAAAALTPSRRVSCDTSWVTNGTGARVAVNVCRGR